MASRPKTEALVEPDMLRWARETAGLSLEQASRSAQTSQKKIEAWESGDKRPSMSQLRRMAVAYKRLLSDFYLPDLVPEQDTVTSPLGTKGVGELGIVGASAAIANAVFHATGARIRDLPITPEKVLSLGVQQAPRAGRVR